MIRAVLTVLAVAVGMPAVPAAASPAHDAGRTPVVFRALAAPSDPIYRLQWDLVQSNWQPAWEAGATGAGRTVAVIDTGVTQGPDLVNVAPGWNFVADNGDAHDDNGHGTHVAGTVAQTTNNGVGVAGVAGQATIVPVKVLDDTGDGTDADIVAGINWAVAQRVDVINLSLGGDGDGGTCAAVANAVANGVTVVAASGNAGGPVSFPAACPGAIAVGATTIDGSVAAYSNRGPQLALTAPGGNMATDLNADGVRDGILQWSVFGGSPGYYLESGTSMAAPHVAGAAALIREAWPGATPTQVRDVLTDTASDRGAAGRDDVYGAGVLDVARAVSRARLLGGGASPTTSPTTAPTTATTPQPGATPTDRIAGDSRYGTAAAIGTAGWGGQAGGAVYLSSGEGFADALATGALSGRRGGPLLLTERCAVPAATVDALRALRPGTVTIVGGAAAVCDGVRAQVEALTGATTSRLAGVDRYATSVELSRAGWPSGSPMAYVASGTNFADALGAATQAAHADAPLLLTSPASMPDAVTAELRRLGATEVRVVGGTSAVSDAVLAAIRALVPTVSRVAGADRYATATTGVQQGWGSGADTVYLASGTAFPDGLAVGSLAAKDHAPLLLVPPCDLPQTVADTLRALRPSKLVVVGGSSAVCDSLLSKMGSAAASQ
jgi:cell wall-associated protease